MGRPRPYYLSMADALTGDRLKQAAIDLGASVVGFCEVEDLVSHFHPEIRETAQKLPYAVSIGIVLQKAVMESITNRPNEIYKFHYRQTNTQLDNITWHLARIIADSGFRAMAIPASKVLKRYPMIGHLNHRELAYKAGLGWRGKNNLLINGLFGSRLRLTTLLTDFEVKVDPITDRDCGKCRACISRCPVGAIGDSPEDFDLEKCSEQVTRFCKENNYGHLICGLCLNSCPVGGRSKPRNG